jgi:hypothetical protein
MPRIGRLVRKTTDDWKCPLLVTTFLCHLSTSATKEGERNTKTKLAALAKVVASKCVCIFGDEAAVKAGSRVQVPKKRNINPWGKADDRSLSLSVFVVCFRSPSRIASLFPLFLHNLSVDCSSSRPAGVMLDLCWCCGEL